VQVHVLHDGATDLIGLVADGKVDFAITPLTHRAGAALRFEPVISTPLVAACPAGHRLAGLRETDVRELLDEPIIDMPRGWWSRDLFDRMLEERDLHRQVGLEVDEWFGVLTMVHRGIGIAYGPQSCIDDCVFGNVEVAGLAEAPSWDLGIATRDEVLRGAAGRAFLDAYRQQCREQAAG
jgi:DNA-binding transcriptional LysR family regulator